MIWGEMVSDRSIYISDNTYVWIGNVSTVYRRRANFRVRNILSVKFSRDLIFEDGYLLENLNSAKICVCDL